MKTESAAIATMTLALCGPTTAGNVTLDFSSLPSAQGWGYYDEGLGLETTVWSISGGALQMDSSPVNASTYFLEGAVDPSQSFSLRFRARVDGGTYGLAVYVVCGGEQVDLHLSPSDLLSNVNNAWTSIASLDTTQFRDYRIDGQFGSGYSLFVDDVLTYSGTFLAIGGNLNRLDLGDAGSLGSGQAEVTAYSFRQPIPEPASWVLMASGLAGLAFAARRRRNR